MYTVEMNGNKIGKMVNNTSAEDGQRQGEDCTREQDMQ